ncbi:hypothetical protein ZHAS_00012723 [Anopheles sinensis]|uniref:Uncharacterized protein n=1 Tax=Anopheles sinensis TaxID=74873 RepID=A0A084W3M0_ANOSI|nr:hypothetical protein ZHAS_00012723 [Anopheles sinensis]
MSTCFGGCYKKPEELLVWNGAGNDGAESQDDGRPVSRIILPEQFATTFQRLENNVVGNNTTQSATASAVPLHCGMSLGKLRALRNATGVCGCDDR